MSEIPERIAEAIWEEGFERVVEFVEYALNGRIDVWLEEVYPYMTDEIDSDEFDEDYEE